MSDEYLKMCDDFLGIISKHEDITGNMVLDMLKKYASNISVFDMMSASAQIIEENKYVQESYRKDSEKSYVEIFIFRIKDIMTDSKDYQKSINKKDITDALETLKSNYINGTHDSQSKTPIMGCMASIYTTFILEEPIHKVGTPFPGSQKVEEKNGKFYCPVKDSNIDTPNAVCNICLAEQSDI